MKKLYKYLSIPCDESGKLSIISRIRFSLMEDQNDPYEGFAEAGRNADDYYLPQNKLIASLSQVPPFGTQNEPFHMWSHYSNGFRGICLEFDFNQNSLDSKITVNEVKYQTNLEKNHWTKHPYWEIEKEIRLSIPRDPNSNPERFYYKSFNEAGLSLAKVHLGSKYLTGNIMYKTPVNENPKIINKANDDFLIRKLKEQKIPIFLCLRKNNEYGFCTKKLF